MFFFSSRRRHTRFKCDWSSDVCSSDLLTRIAINEALMLLRRARGLREVSIADLSGHEETVLALEMRDSRAGPVSVFLHGQQSRILSAATDKLPPSTRTAVELRELAELSTRAAARVR